MSWFVCWTNIKKIELVTILRLLILLLIKHSIRVRVGHIPGKENNLCDLLSRTQDILDAVKRYGILPTSTPIAPHLLPENFPLIWGKALGPRSMQPSTKLQYLRQLNYFVDFCHTVIEQTNLSLIASNHVTQLPERQLSYKSIRTYLFAASCIFRLREWNDPTSGYIVTKTLGQGVQKLSRAKVLDLSP